MIRTELLKASDADIDDAMEHTNPMVLRGLLYQLTGDESVAEIPTEQVPAGFWGNLPAILDADNVALLRSKAAAFLKDYRDSGAGECDIGPPERLPKAMELTVGSPIPENEIDLWIEQMGLDPMERGLVWREQPRKDKLDDFKVAVLGTGMGGLSAAVQLKRAGIPFTVFEKNRGVGGTWYENRYPGARVDSGNRLYTHTFALGFSFPARCSVQEVNERYLNWMADHFDVRDHIRFETEVELLEWDEEAGRWNIHAVGPDGKQTSHANAIISAVGFLSRPNIPEFKGSETFEGPIFHTSRWPEGFDHAGKRVAVIGSGATSYQMVPELVKKVGHVSLFQRSPSWCMESPGYLSLNPPQVPWLDRNFPYLVNFFRLAATWNTRTESLWGFVRVDPDHRDPDSVSPANKRLRDHCMAFIDRKLGDRPDLRDRMIPDTPVFATRPVVVDSDYCIYDALRMDNAELITDPIERFTPRGILTKSGEEHEFDAIVLATGFKANDFLSPLQVIGRGGRTVGEVWSRDGARAYLGSCVPGFPNFFMLYGPNMNPVGSGLGAVDFMQMSTRFALKCIEHLILNDRKAVDVTDEAYQRFADALDREQALMVYVDKRVTSYYRNEFGRSAVNNPFKIRYLWNWLRDPGQYDEEIASQLDETAKPFIGEDLMVD